jgi:putative endonuclease
VDEFHVYVMSNRRGGRLYVGVTNAIRRRVLEHNTKASRGFTSRYNLDKLVFAESATDPLAAIRREKEIKGWLRSRKIALIESINPGWEDLAADWFGEA